VEVRIASPYLTYDNIKVKRRELWGTDIYTDDSDVVASTSRLLSVKHLSTHDCAMLDRTYN
jgi:hypothetical protein